MSADKSPLTEQAASTSWNFNLLSQNDLGGFGGMGEGMSVQIAKDGRRIIWLAHESAPKNFTGVDVSDPRNPKVIAQTDLPKPYMRSNSLELSGDIMAVAYQTQKVNQRPAGLELFDLSVPEKPRSIAFLDCSGVNSRGVHQLWFCDGEYVHMASGAPDFEPSHSNDDQFYRCIDVRNPSKPVSHWTNSPPYTGFMHTAVPLFDRGLLIVTDESTENNAEDWPKLVWVVDARDEKNLVSIATCPLPPVDAYANRGGRFGAHNI